MKDLLFKLRTGEITGIKYGYYYNYHAAILIDIDGWHLPTEGEWQTLLSAVGATSQERSNNLRSIRTVPDEHPRWELPNTGAADAYNFRAVPNGSADVGLGIEAYYWTATAYTVDSVKKVRINTTSAQVMSGGAFKRNPYAVRLVKDDLTGFPSDGDTGTMEDREGNVYQAVRIGTQVWMAENLGTTLIDASTSIENIGDLTIFLDAATPAYRAINNDITFAFEFEAITLDHSPDGWDDGILNLTRNKTLIGITRSYTVKLKFVKEGAYFIRNIFYTNGVDADLDLEIWKLNRISMQYELIYIGDFDFETFEDTDNGVDITTKNITVSQLIKANGDTAYDISGDYESDRKIMWDSYLGVITEEDAAPIYCLTLKTVLKALISKVADYRGLTYTYDFDSIDSVAYHICNGWEQFTDYKRVIINLSLNDLLKTIFILTGKVLDIEIVNNTEHLSLKDLSDIYDDTLTALELGNVTNISFKPDESSNFNKVKIGYKKQSYEYKDVLDKEALHASVIFESQSSKKVDDFDFMIPIRADLYELHYDIVNKIITEFDGNRYPFTEICLVELQAEIDPIFPAITAYEPVRGNVRISDAALPVIRPNLSISPRNTFLMRLDYLSSMIGKDGDVYQFASGDYLISDIQINEGSGYVNENMDITIDEEVYFKPFTFEFDTYIDEDFFETLSSNPATPISFEFEGNAYVGFLLDTKIKLHGKSKARIKLLSAASNDLTKLIR